MLVLLPQIPQFGLYLTHICCTKREGEREGRGGEGRGGEGRGRGGEGRGGEGEGEGRGGGRGGESPQSFWRYFFLTFLLRDIR